MKIELGKTSVEIPLVKLCSWTLVLLTTAYARFIWASENIVFTPDFKSYQIATNATMNDFQLDIVEERYYRALKNKDIEAAARLKKKMERLQRKQEVFDKLQIKNN